MKTIPGAKLRVMESAELHTLEQRPEESGVDDHERGWRQLWHMVWAIPAYLLVAMQPASTATWVATALLTSAVLVLNVHHRVRGR